MRAALLSGIPVAILLGCAVSAPISPANSSKSKFDGAVYKGETVTTGAPTSGNEAYRVFIQGASGFVAIGAVRDEAEQRAKEFCGRTAKSMHSLSETTAAPPYILGNYPRIEIVFDCVAGPATVTQNPTGESKYARLAEAKKLLDEGTITREEFDREKTKILNQP